MGGAAPSPVGRSGDASSGTGASQMRRAFLMRKPEPKYAMATPETRTPEARAVHSTTQRPPDDTTAPGHTEKSSCFGFPKSARNDAPDSCSERAQNTR
jgi:hypothetical protein